MQKQEIYELLKQEGIRFEVTEHQAVFNMEELAGIEIPYPEQDAKNLFVRDDKKRNYYLITVKGDKHIDLKMFRKAYGTRALSFASSEDLMAYMGLLPGSVTPMGLLNDTLGRVKFFLDRDFEEESLIGVHPNENTATVWLKVKDLIRLLKKYGVTVQFVSLEQV